MKKGCTFCSIINEPEIQKVYEDDTNVIIEDIRPAADLHLLVLPREHIRDITTIDDAKTLDSLLLTAKAHLADFEKMEKHVGFHQPPFNSQYHLHMHIVSGKMNAKQRKRILNPGWTDIEKAYEPIDFLDLSSKARAPASMNLPNPSELNIPPPPSKCSSPPPSS